MVTPEVEEAEVHPVVELLVKRMASNPEEFLNGRWTWLDTHKMKHFTEKEAKVFNGALRKLYMDELHSKVMKQLLDPEADKMDKDDQYRAYLAQTLQQNGLAQALQASQYQNLLASPSPSPPPSSSSLPTPYATAKKLIGW